LEEASNDQIKHKRRGTNGYQSPSWENQSSGISEKCRDQTANLITGVNKAQRTEQPRDFPGKTFEVSGPLFRQSFFLVRRQTEKRELQQGAATGGQPRFGLVCDNPAENCA
jgi:hypothetical protein